MYPSDSPTSNPAVPIFLSCPNCASKSPACSQSILFAVIFSLLDATALPPYPKEPIPIINTDAIAITIALVFCFLIKIPPHYFYVSN